jgi:hypothetical protein
MARISTYPIDTVVTAKDKWIGTDSAGTITKNFTAENVAAYLNNNSVIQGTGTRYKFQLQANLLAGGFALSPDQGASVSFSSVSDIKINIKDLALKVMSPMYIPLVGSRILVQRASNISTFAVYDWESAIENENNPNFYDVTLTYVGGNGSLQNEEDYLISLLTYDIAGSSDKHYAHNQSLASTTWSITHNLNKYPSVTVVLSTGKKGYGDVTYTDKNNLLISFTGAESGKAYMN